MTPRILIEGCAGLARVRHPGNHAYVWRLDGERLASPPYPRHPKRRAD